MNSPVVQPRMEPPATRSSGRAAEIACAVLVVLFVAGYFAAAFDRYTSFNSEWAFDLGYFNQWFWLVVRPGDTLTLRPLGSVIVEGPELWRINHLEPIRLAFLPFYAALPGVGTLLFLQTAGLAAGAIPAFRIAARRTGNRFAGLLAAALYLSAPFVNGYALNDFRPIHLLLPALLYTLEFLEAGRRRAFWVAAIVLLSTRPEAAMMLGLLVCGHLAGAWLSRCVAARRLVRPTGPWSPGVPALGLAAGWLLLLAGYDRFILHAPAGFGVDVLPALPGLLANLPVVAREAWRYWGWFLLPAAASPLALCLGLPVVYVLAGNGLFTTTPGETGLHYTIGLSAAVFVGLLDVGCRAWTSVARRFSARAAGVGFAVLLLPVLWAGAAGLLDARARFAVTDETRRIHGWIRDAGDGAVTTHHTLAAALSSRRVIWVHGSYPPGVDLQHALAESDWLFYRKGDFDRALETYIAVEPDGPFRIVDRTERYVLLARRRGGAGGAPGPLARTGDLTRRGRAR